MVLVPFAEGAQLSTIFADATAATDSGGREGSDAGSEQSHHARNQLAAGFANPA